MAYLDHLHGRRRHGRRWPNNKQGSRSHQACQTSVQRSGCELGEAYGQATAQVIPLQRFGTPEEVGHAEAFFASLQAS